MSEVERRARGVTLTEMLAVVAIMMILSMMAVGGFLQRVHLARVKRAHAETRIIAEAELMCAAIHGYFVPLQVLDDIANVPGATGGSRDDSINNEHLGIFLIDPNIPVNTQLLFQRRLSDAGAYSRVNRLLTNWQGPFLQPKDVYIGDAQSDDPADLDIYQIQYDYPLDPWGQPYRFYSPLGLVGTSAEAYDPDTWSQLGFSDGHITTDENRFDRFAIVSYGPDQDSDWQRTLASDDIIYFFGFTYNETTYNKF